MESTFGIFTSRKNCRHCYLRVLAYGSWSRVNQEKPEALDVSKPLHSHGLHLWCFVMYVCSNLFPEEGFTSSWWPVLSESLKNGSALWGFVDSKALGGEQKVTTLRASFLPPVFVLLPHTSHSVLYVSILLVSSSTQQIKHCFSPNCEQCTSSSVFRGHRWKPWWSWKSFSYSSLFQHVWSSSMLKMHHCSACFSREASLFFIPEVLGRESSLAGKKSSHTLLYWWFDH